MPEGIINTACYLLGFLCGQVGKLISVAPSSMIREKEEGPKQILNPRFEEEIERIENEVREVSPNEQ